MRKHILFFARETKMEATQKGQEITLKREVRTLTIQNPRFNILSHADTRWLRAGEKVRVSEEKWMSYDHRDQRAVQVLGHEPERFILVAELEQNPSHLKGKPDDQPWLNADKLEVEYIEESGAGPTGKKVRATIRFARGPYGTVQTEWYTGRRGVELVVQELAKALGREVVEEKEEK